jgi:hypothetical protein
VPVTARLSKAFYDRLGEEIANELVEWFNQVDATYRSDLRDINELNFARFDAKLEQRMAALEGKFERRLGELDSKIDRVASDLRTDYKSLESVLERGLKEQLRWMFVAWTALLIPIIGLWFR